MDGTVLARRWQRAIFATGRPTATHTASGLGSDAVLVHAPGVLPDEAHGPAAVDRLGRALHEAFSIDAISLEPPIAADGRIALRWTIRGVHVGPYLGVAPTGRRVEIQGVDVLRVGDDRIAEVWRTYDRLALLRRLGASSR